MTRPGRRPPAASAAEQRLAASLSGAVDLSGIKSRVEARKDAEKRATGPGGAGAGDTSSIDVDETTFEKEVLERSNQVPVVLELTSRRAPTAMTATFAALAAQSGGTWVHARIDAEANPGIVQALQVKAVPFVTAVAAGRPLADFEGEQPEEALRQWIAAVLQATEGRLTGPVPSDGAAAADAGEPEDPERDAAEQALADGDLEAAEKAYSALADARPGDHTLLEALRFVQVQRRLETDAYEGPNGEIFKTADGAMLSGDVSGAFGGIIAAVRTSAGDDKAALRERLVELFDALPANDPEVLAARRDLASALY